MKSGKWRLVLKIIISLVIVGFLIQRLIQSYSQISQYTFSINYSSLILALIFGIIGFSMFGMGWIFAIRICGYTLGLNKGMITWFKSQMIKYLPGTIWMFLSRVYDCKKFGIEKKTAILSIYLECALLGLSAVIISILMNYKIVGGYIHPGILIPIFIASLLLVHPTILNKILSIFKKQNLKINDYSFSKLLGLLLFYAASWLPICAGFVFLANSITPIPAASYAYVAGTFVLAWVVGFIAIFSPGGIGVREGLISLILAQILPEPIAIIIAFGSRIWWIAIETGSFGLWFLVRRLSAWKART